MRISHLGIIMLFLLAGQTPRSRAAGFGPDWRQKWKQVYSLRDSTVRRTVDGALDVDAVPKKTIFFAGGESRRDMRVTARIKFLRASGKYSGFSVYVRWRGEAWASRDGYWIYLRPKYRGLYMQKVAGGSLDKDFEAGIQAERPRATPLNEWMTLCCEVRGRRIRVFLNDECLLTATDDSLFPVLRGGLAFGVGDARVVIRDLTYENLEREERLVPRSYRYVNPPTRGDPKRTILTDGRVNLRPRQAFWRMLGPRPEMIFDLGREVFLTRMNLRAISSPAVNIASAEVLGSTDGEAWHVLATLDNRESRRAVAEYAIGGPIRGIARYVKLVLQRPAADQDVELAEVELYGRGPTAEDRAEVGTREYDTGPPMPPLPDPLRSDDRYIVLTGSMMQVAIRRSSGVVAGIWNRQYGDKPCLLRVSAEYHLATRAKDVDADEYGDRVTNILADGSKGLVRLQCLNPRLPGIRIDKCYRLASDGRRLIVRTGFVNTGSQRDWFLTPALAAIAAEDFRRGAVYMGGDRGLGSRLFADEVTTPRRIGGVGGRNTKVVLLQRYDLGWGIAQFRHKINDTWCRPLTARYYEKENHPPMYLPNGWDVGLCTLHLRPHEEQSVEVQTALYEGRQIDFYRLWRFLPDTAAAWESAGDRPRWQKRLKTSARLSPPQLTGDQERNLLPMRRSLAVTDTGNLWCLLCPHGVWGEWFSQGVVTSGVGARIDMRWVDEMIRRMHGLSPRLKAGVYTWAWAVHPRANVFREHPEWFVRRDRSGQSFNAYSNMVLNHLRLIGAPGSREELIGQFRDLMRTCDGDYFYLDGGGGGANLIDWEHLAVDYDTDWEALYRRIREITRECGKEKAVWFNARSGPWWDIGFYEGVDRCLRAATWRESADAMSAVKIRQVFDPNQVVVPLYWRSETRPFFSNYCIGLGITPSSPLGADDLLRKLPFVEAAYETRGLTWTEANLKPDWRVDRRTRVEAHALKDGRAGILSVIDHREHAAAPVHIEADTAAFGLSADHPLHVFVYGNRDIRRTWKALPEAVRREVYRRTGWGLDLVGRWLDVRSIATPGSRLRLELPATKNELCLSVLNPVPAGVFSVNGLRVNFPVPALWGALVSHEFIGEALLRLRLHAPSGGAEFLVCAPPGTCFGPGRWRSFIFHDRALAIVGVEAGDTVVDMALEPMPPPGEALAVTCPDTIASGSSLSVRLSPIPKQATVAVWRDDVLVAVQTAPVREGTLSLAVPPEARSGHWNLAVQAVIGGRRSSGRATFDTTGSFDASLPPVHPPKRYPVPVIEKVDVHRHGVHVIAAASNSSDGYDGRHVPLADPAHLRFGGSMSVAPCTRYGYAYGGLEVEKARVLTLRVTNTIFGAWTYNRDRESFKPQYTTTFAGLLVDYYTGGGYTRRVALGCGLLNPKRATPRPLWGCKTKADRFVSLGDMVHQSGETVCTIDLGRWAPPDWTGRCWLSAGVGNLYPGRGLIVEILEAAAEPGGKTILEGTDLGTLLQGRTYKIVHVAAPPILDGRVGDDCWKKAMTAAHFYLFGRPVIAPQATRAWMVVDAKNLYVAFDCPESERDIQVSAAKLWGRDAVDVALNPSGDRKTFLQIIVDAAGRFDQFSHQPSGAPFRWRGVRVATARGKDGWSAEIAVPLDAMHLVPEKGGEWVGNFVRYRANDPMSTWSFMPGPAINDPERMATLVFQ